MIRPSSSSSCAPVRSGPEQIKFHVALDIPNPLIGRVDTVTGIRR